jgi:hypothetical protein
MDALNENLRLATLEKIASYTIRLTVWPLNLAVAIVLLIGEIAHAQQKPHVFVSPLTHSGSHTAALNNQYRFDRALERAVAKKYALVPSSTPPALLGKYMKSDGYFWIGGSWGYGCEQTCKSSFTYSAYAAHSKGNVEYPLKSCDVQEAPEQCAQEALAYLDDVISKENAN